MRPEDGDPLTIIREDDQADIRQASTGGPDFTVKDWPPPHHRLGLVLAVLLGFALLVVIGLRVAG